MVSRREKKFEPDGEEMREERQGEGEIYCQLPGRALRALEIYEIYWLYQVYSAKGTRKWRATLQALYRSKSTLLHLPLSFLCQMATFLALYSIFLPSVNEKKIFLGQENLPAPTEPAEEVCVPSSLP